MTKIPWLERMIRQAESWAQYSTCVQAKFGAVLFHPETHRIISMGYNDAPMGWMNCGDGGCPQCADPEQSVNYLLDCRCVHAEMNAVLLAGRYGPAIDGVSIALAGPKPPCRSCLKHLTQVGVKYIVSRPLMIYNEIDVASNHLIQVPIEQVLKVYHDEMR